MPSRSSSYTRPTTTNTMPTNQDDVPSEPPPPYSLEADGANSFAMNRPQQSPPPLPQNTRPQQRQSQKPQSGPSNSRPQNQSMQVNYLPDQNYSPPLPPRPRPPYSNYTPAAGGKLLYPTGYRCEKCGNTGYKYSTGLPCRRCFERFAAPQAPNVHTLQPAASSQCYYPNPSIYLSAPAPARVVHPGDPSIGGVLCGACKGRGVVDEFGLGNTLGGMLGSLTTCRVCKGVGRLL
ncbi:hypothetical protein V1505DRAFT_369717 [Lipomyces doorenjongii]